MGKNLKGKELGVGISQRKGWIVYCKIYRQKRKRKATVF